MFRNTATLLGFFAFFFLQAQRPAEQPTSSEIIHKLQTLNTLGSVLYIAAHPDDENTRLISYLANGAHVRTAYLSLTRGSGGQNLIGENLGDPLGIIRTNELLEARRIDGGIQYFSRAVDFGYSKTAEESFEKWGKEEVLGDVVRVIRDFKPDVIVTRFPATSRAGHGHHTASAILALEAFDLASDPNAYPEQLEQGLSVWKTQRMFWNGSLWWDEKLPEIAESEPDWISIDVGQYDPLLGLSYTELAGRSRSMHKSQGFGSAESKGSLIEYLHFEKGSRIATNDPFVGIDMTWARILGGAGIGKLIDQLIRNFDPLDPTRIADAFELLHNEISKLPQSHYKSVKLQELEDLMIDVTATSIEFLVEEHNLATGTRTTGKLELLARGPFPVDYIGTKLSNGKTSAEQNLLLTNQMQEVEVPVIASTSIDQPYWLAKPHGALFDVEDPRMYTLPTAPQQLYTTVMLRIAGIVIERSIPAMYKWVDRVDGERTRPVVVTPAASLRPSKTIVIANNEAVRIDVEVTALVDSLHGKLLVELPKGWGTTKDLKVINGLKKGERTTFTFTLMKSDKAEAGHAAFKLVTDNDVADKTMHTIDHGHILPQTYYTQASAQLVPIDLNISTQRVGYIPGAGDRIPEGLTQLGITVETINTATATLEQLKGYDAIVAGIRAYNTDNELQHFNKTLLEYVAFGGTLLVQYNTNRGLMENIGPYPFKVTRDRVTVEEAPTKMLEPNSPLMTYPNEISEADFHGWIQERGLYFTTEQAPEYRKLFSWSDPGEEPADGALIYCDHGKGRFIYTGISFFRQLPAGVPGAYRLFANLIAPRAK